MVRRLVEQPLSSTSRHHPFRRHPHLVTVLDEGLRLFTRPQPLRQIESNSRATNYRWTSWRSSGGPSGGARSRTCRAARSVRYLPEHQALRICSCREHSSLLLLSASGRVLGQCGCMGAWTDWCSFFFFYELWQTSLRELTTLGIKNAENLAIPSVRNDVRLATQLKNVSVTLFSYLQIAMVQRDFVGILESSIAKLHMQKNSSSAIICSET